MRSQFAATLDHPVPFRERRFRQHLTEAEWAAVAGLHPNGFAPCWGGTRSQAAKLDQLQRGDVVLFTGRRHVQGVGEVGTVLHNHDFAQAVWGPHPRRCSFEVAYTLVSFRRIKVRYEVLQAALGTSPRDNFQALRLVRDQKRIDAVHELVDRGV